MFKKYYRFAPWLIFCGSLGLLIGGAFLQQIMNLEPCPMCIVQRYIWIIVALVSLWQALKPGWSSCATLGLVSSTGIFVAARQTWLQLNPPDFPECGRDLYGMIEQLPLSRALPMIFKGSGDCSAIDWTFLGLSIANWSLVGFTLVLSWSLFHLFKGRKLGNTI